MVENRGDGDHNVKLSDSLQNMLKNVSDCSPNSHQAALGGGVCVYWVVTLTLLQHLVVNTVIANFFCFTF